ncbi:MAG: acyl-CoA thioesterase [Candidatus Eremiobacteraeota bacterium]|nr:acyl-CoA thioesterase [Candidatus Eremiobacteraeota bacterium]
MLEDFRLVHRFRVPFAGVDMMRHVNNVAYATWAETVRTEYFGDVFEERIGGPRGIILAKTEIVYEKPIAYRENVAVGGRVGTIGGKSFAFRSEVWSVDRGERCATIDCTLVAFDYETNTTIRVPDEWRVKIAAYEGRAAELPAAPR